MNEAPVALGEIGQIAISVTDLDRSTIFYRDAVGLRFLFSAPNVAFFDCNGVRLMLGLDPATEVPPRGTVIYFRVPDINLAHEQLAARGVFVEREPQLIARMPDHELWMSFFRDPDQHLFALMSEVRSSS